jgi:hypothetical protein
MSNSGIRVNGWDLLLSNLPVYLSVPSFSTLIDPERREVMLQVAKEEDSPYQLEMCLQHEHNGMCRVRVVLGFPPNSVIYMQSFSQIFTLPSSMITCCLLSYRPGKRGPFHCTLSPPACASRYCCYFPLSYYPSVSGLLLSVVILLHPHTANSV